MVKAKFKHSAYAISPRDFTTIEFHIRQGTKKLDILKNPHVIDIHV